LSIDKRQYLKENGWFESSKDKLWVNDKGEIDGFRPESEGITLEEAFKKLIQSNER
jgi:hypothetical protein